MKESKAQQLFKQLPDKINDRYVKLQVQWIGEHSRMPVMAKLVEEMTPDMYATRVPEEYHPDFMDDDYDGSTIEEALQYLIDFCRERGYIE